MRLLFDYQIFQLQTHGGISRYYAEAASTLAAYGADCTIAVRRSDNIHLQQLSAPNSVPGDSIARKKIARAHYFGKRTLERLFPRLTAPIRDANRRYSIRLLEKGDFDIFEPTYFDPYFVPLLRGKPFTLHIHDMIPELFPQYFPADDFQIINKRLLAPLAAHILVPSQHTKNDVVRLLDIPPHKISVVPHATPLLTKSISKTKTDSRFRLADIKQSSNQTIKRSQTKQFNKYLLFVGQRTLYKNFIPLLHEFAALAEKDKDLQLVCTGLPFDHEEQQIINELNLSSRVTQLFVTDDELTDLYRNALAFVFPSAYEGFGFPILEAFSCGCPVMLNNASCFPEIGGDAAIYFDIDRRGDFASVFNDMLSQRDSLIEKGYQRAKQFSWHNIANQLLNIYHETIHNNS